MMTHLLEAVRGLVADELAESRKNFDEYFHSPHEGYGVLMEEVQEAEEEIKCVQHYTDDMILRCIRYHAGTGRNMLLESALKSAGEAAIRAACEYIQVAAMAQKMRESMNRGREP